MLKGGRFHKDLIYAELKNNVICDGGWSLWGGSGRLRWFGDAGEVGT